MDNSKDSLEYNFNKINEAKKSFEKYQKKWIEYSKTNNISNTSRIKRQWEFFKDKVKWFQAWLINFFGVPESQRTRMRDMMLIGEIYIGNQYKIWTMDCSMMISILLCAFQWKKAQRLWSSSDFAKFKNVWNYNNARFWDIMNFPWHSEMVVWKAFTINGITYLPTFWSATDTNKVDPMFDKNWKPITWKNWVWYRYREVYPHPRHPYTYNRPPYNTRLENNKT